MPEFDLCDGGSAFVTPLIEYKISVELTLPSNTAKGFSNSKSTQKKKGVCCAPQLFN
jgi:hypothetical protein